MRIAICDDNKEYSANLENMIENMRIRDIEVDIFDTGQNLLNYLENEERGYYQIFLMDIEMPGINGIDAAKKIREEDQNAVIIFMTSYTEYVFDVFEVQPFRFLSKPFDDEQFKNVMEAAFNYLYTNKKYLMITVDKMKIQLPCDKVMYFEGDKRRITAYTIEQQYTFYNKINDLEQKLNNSWFIRIHASYLINIDYLKELRCDLAVMINGDVLPISKRYKKCVKLEHLRYMKWRLGF